MRRPLGSTLFALLLLAPSARAAEDLAAHIEAVINAPRYKQAHWGLLIVDSQSGQVLYEHNADRLFAPASTTKLYSCATALCLLGPDFKFKTPVFRRGEIDKGRLRGDLILVASGDLTLGGRTGKDGTLAFKDNDHTYANGNPKAELTDTKPLGGLKTLARQVKEAGIREVTGDVLVDDRLFERARGTGSGPDVLSPILVNDNVVDIVITPGARAGDAALVKMRPRTSYVQIDARVKTVAKGEPSLTLLRAPDSRRFTVRGQVPLGAKPLVRIFPVEDPAAFARALFIEALRGAGIEVQASPLQAPRGELPPRGVSLERVAEFESPPLSEAIKVTLKVSHNLYASTLPLLVASYDTKHHYPKTLAGGLRAQGAFLKELGVNVETISFGGGAGGSPADMVTPRATVQLLRAMQKRPEWSTYRSCLPVLGVDGTLAEAVAAESPARGKAMAKTGTLGWGDLMNERALLRSKALAGVLTTAKGRELTIAFFVNDVPLPRGTTTTSEGKTLGKLCEVVYRDCP
jgi:D-alanyl-D-alanine carboxypeptidase/D-alanyl-D-alanine-endopeptidase (penicillin-binding protein 4)